MFKVSKAGVIRPRGSWVTALEASEKPLRPRRKSTTAKLSSTKPAAVLGARGASSILCKVDIFEKRKKRAAKKWIRAFSALCLPEPRFLVVLESDAVVAFAGSSAMYVEYSGPAVAR